MNAVTGGEGEVGGTVPNPHDYVSSPKYRWLVEETNTFMDENPDVVAQMEQVATILIGTAEGDCTVVSQGILRLPDTIPHAGERKYPGSGSDDPLIGLRLTFDSQVKRLSGHSHFVHDVPSGLYEAVRFPRTEESSYEYDAFGLIAVDNLSPALDYRPDLALALSRDRKYAAIVRRVPDSELMARSDEKAVGMLVSTALSMSSLSVIEGKEDSHGSALQDEVRGVLVGRELPPRIEKAIVAILGADTLSSIRAGGEGRLDGDPEPVTVPSKLLRAVKALLDAGKSVRKTDQ